MGLGYVIYTLLPRIRATEQRITRELLPGGWESGSWDARFDLKGLLRGDAAARAAFYGAMMDRLVMTNADVAELEDMDPPEREVYVTLGNFSTIDPTTFDVTPMAQPNVSEGAQP
jgi:phage portal protein BeeE